MRSDDEMADLDGSVVSPPLAELAGGVGATPFVRRRMSVVADERPIAALVVAALLSGAGCDVYDASLLDGPVRDAGRDLGMDAGDASMSDDADSPDLDETLPPPDADPDTSTNDDAGAGCPTRRPPERPATADGPSMPVRWYAVRNFRPGTGVAWRDIGYDLDGRCTTSDSPSEELECAPPPGFSPASDGPGGVDNTLGQTFFPLLTIINPDYEAEVNEDLDDGIFGLLIRVAEWNGTSNDPVVDVALVDAYRGYAAGGDIAGPTPLERPTWDGTDEWIATQRSFVAGDFERPLARDTSGYIVDGLLVARPRDGTEVNLSAQTTLTVKLTRGLLTARLTDGNRALTDVILAGRMALDDIYNTLPRLDICSGGMSHTAILEALRRAADVTTGGEATPTLLCEAISVGLGFEAVLAQFGGVVMERRERDLCDGIDNQICTTTCPTAEDGICDDGGSSSQRVTCELGTDCGDCRSRPG